MDWYSESERARDLRKKQRRQEIFRNYDHQQFMKRVEWLGSILVAVFAIAIIWVNV